MDLLLAAVIASLITLAMCSCAAIKDAAGEAGGTAADYIACPLGLFDCGHVYLFPATPAENALNAVELCVDDDDHPQDLLAAELMFGPSVPTPRHQGICRWCAGLDCGAGCNAFGGCFLGAR